MATMIILISADGGAFARQIHIYRMVYLEILQIREQYKFI